MVQVFSTRSNARLDRRKFRCPPLSRKRKKQIVEEANAACDELIRFSASEMFDSAEQELYNHGDDAVKWQHFDQIQSIKIERVKIRSETKKSMYYFRGITQMEAAIEDVMKVYKVNVDHPNLELEAKISQLIHSTILYEVKPYDPVEELIFVGIRWAEFQLPYLFVRHRDLCFLECQRMFRLADGRRGFARCLHSVKLQSCPEMEADHGLIRASIYRSGTVFLESRRDRRILECVHAMYIDLKGKVPRWIAAAGMRKHLLSLEELKKYVNMQRLVAQPFAKQQVIQSREKAKACFVCVDDLGTFRRRFQCKKCGEVICRRCKICIYAEVPIVGRMKLTICSLCSLAVDRGFAPDTNLDYDSSGERPCTTPLPVYRDGGNAGPSVRKRALSVNSFHTANIDQSTVYSLFQSHNGDLDDVYKEGTESNLPLSNQDHYRPRA
ncbi:unnamed protein product [Albugo candida]|uniref:FYVE-type domain-containing protein n=1 Tax=Albugo candida TaxID=65357 RepID=A0A024GD83_9STRA|nr:unnamed protein product [Albugo candida]|eukprot:CCI44732.1 unnamed protein product [Albugo candida]